MKLRRGVLARRRRRRCDVKRRVLVSAVRKPMPLDLGRTQEFPLVHCPVAWVRRPPRSWQLAYRLGGDHGRQSGQALSEMLLLTSALVGLCLAFNYLDTRRVAVLESTHQSRYRAFAQARGEAFEAGSVSATQAVDLPAAAAQVGSSAPAQELARDWLQLGQGWVSAASSAAYSINRHSVLASGAGHGQHAGQVQQRVAASALGWRNAASASQQTAASLNAELSRQDVPWARRRIASDWLAPWADLASAARGKP